MITPAFRKYLCAGVVLCRKKGYKMEITKEYIREIQNAETLPAEGKRTAEGIELTGQKYILANTGEDRLYCVGVDIGCGGAVAEFFADARCEQEAADRVADYCEENGYSGYAGTLEDADWSDDYSSVDEYAEANGYVTAGNHCLFLKIVWIREVG